uniref:Secreted protein n=1 Tax=Schistocephalus solidus TaxID=70667 RepID=A0A183TUR8_SCHSO
LAAWSSSCSGISSAARGISSGSAVEGGGGGGGGEYRGSESAGARRRGPGTSAAFAEASCACCSTSCQTPRSENRSKGKRGWQKGLGGRQEDRQSCVAANQHPAGMAEEKGQKEKVRSLLSETFCETYVPQIGSNKNTDRHFPLFFIHPKVCMTSTGKLNGLKSNSWQLCGFINLDAQILS